MTRTIFPPGGITELVMCLTSVKIDHEIIFTTIFLPSADSRRVDVSYKQKYVQEVQVNCLVEFDQEKAGSGELTIPTGP